MKKSNEKLSKDQINLLRNSVLFSLTRRGWAGRAKVRRSDMAEKVKTNAADNRLGVTKELIECKEFDEVWEVLTGVYNWCCDNSMPGFGMKKGISFVRKKYFDSALGKEVDNVERFEAKIAAAEKELYDVKLPAFIKAFDGAKQAAKLPKSLGGLGDLFNEDDYPTDAELRAAFRIEHSWFQISVPDELPDEIRDREVAKLKETFKAAQDEMRYALRLGFKELLEEAVERLTQTGDFKGKMFRKDSLNAFNFFMETFNAKDMTDDAELANMVSRVRAITGNLPDAEILRDDATIAAEAAAKFKEVKKAVTNMIIEKPKRRFALSDD